MAAPSSRHGAARGELEIERCYEPDRARQVAALLALLKQTPAPEAGQPVGTWRLVDTAAVHRLAMEHARQDRAGNEVPLTDE